MCGTRFNYGEARLQQWVNRETHQHYVHAHCVNGVLCHDHEVLSKQATDQDAVDALTRQRDTITRTAADTEVLLLIAEDPDQASTAAPPDDEQDLFGREEALRMDEEIIDFQWFEHVTWDSIKDLRGTTYVPPHHKVQVCFTASSTCHSSSHHSQQPFLIDIRVRWESVCAQQLAPSGTTSVNASESNCGHFLDARLELFFWAEDWSALWAMVRAECDISAECDTQNRHAAEAVTCTQSPYVGTYW